MTPSQLREWSFRKSQPDQWWLSLDSVIEGAPVTVAEIEERMNSRQYINAHVIHVSQANMSNAPWVEVALHTSVRPPVAVYSSNTSFAPHAASSIARSEHLKPDETLGIITLIIPLVGAFLIWYNTADLFLPLGTLVVCSTTILVSIEANKLGFGKKKFDNEGKELNEFGPIGWAIFLLAFWIISLPWYMYSRSKYGVKNMLAPGIFIALLYFTIICLAEIAIDKSSNEYAQQLNEQANSNFEEINKQVTRDVIKQYEIAKRSGTAMDRYVQAGLVAAVFLQAKDEANYRAWKSIERIDGFEAGVLTEVE